jgi:hypothetical protein
LLNTNTGESVGKDDRGLYKCVADQVSNINADEEITSLSDAFPMNVLKWT